MLGKLYGRYKGKLDSAELYLENATKLSPSDPAPFKDLGIVYSMKNDFNNAILAFQSALKLAPNDPDIKQNIALTYRLIEQKKRQYTVK